MVNMESEAAVDGSAGTGGRAIGRSRRRVVYRRPVWRVRQWAVEAGGAAVCRAAALRVSGGLLLWVGAGVGAPLLGAVALGMPAGGAGPERALATLLAGDAGAEGERAAGLARRLAAALGQPVHVCCSVPLDRFTAPLIERGLIAEIKSRPQFFSD